VLYSLSLEEVKDFFLLDVLSECTGYHDSCLNIERVNTLYIKKRQTTENTSRMLAMKYEVLTDSFDKSASRDQALARGPMTSLSAEFITRLPPS
jgi:hypothetical protein